MTTYGNSQTSAILTAKTRESAKGGAEEINSLRNLSRPLRLGGEVSVRIHSRTAIAISDGFGQTRFKWTILFKRQ